MYLPLVSDHDFYNVARVRSVRGKSEIRLNKSGVKIGYIVDQYYERNKSMKEISDVYDVSYYAVNKIIAEHIRRSTLNDKDVCKCEDNYMHIKYSDGIFWCPHCKKEVLL